MKRIIYALLWLLCFLAFSQSYAQGIEIQGPSYVCDDATTVRYSAVLNGSDLPDLVAGATYRWSLNNGIGVITNLPEYDVNFQNVSPPYTLSVTYDNPDAGTTQSGSKSIGSYSVGTISADRLWVCPFNAVNLTATGYSGEDFSWGRQINNGDWEILTDGIPNPGGGITFTGFYTDVPTTPGFVRYRLYLNTRAPGGCGILSTPDDEIIEVRVGEPDAPAFPQVINNCGVTILTKGTAPDGVTWYWQLTDDGTETEPENEASSLTLTEPGVRYLRAKTDAGNCWSIATVVNYNFKSLPGLPPAPVVNNECGFSTLERADPPADIVYYWQSTSDGLSTDQSDKTLTFTDGNVYFIRAYNEVTECWSPSLTVNYAIGEIPAKPTAMVDGTCGSTTVTRGTPPQNVIWYWQTSADGTDNSLAQAVSSLTFTQDGTIYLRAQHNGSLCWSEAEQINFTVEPAVPIPPVLNEKLFCEVTVVYTDQTPPADVEWYFQDSPSGTSTSSRAQEVFDYLQTDLRLGIGTQYESDGIAYLRAYDAVRDCWSEARIFDYSFQNASIWYLDADNDGFAISTMESCESPGEGYTLTELPVTDCDDSDPLINPNTKWYLDSDGDGFGDPNAFVMQCLPPDGYVDNGDDLCPGESGEGDGCPELICEPTELSTDENYVYVKTYRKSVNNANGATEQEDLIENISYFDGLGRDKQDIAIKASPNCKDIITHFDYDEYGRQARSFLPYPSATTPGSFKATEVIEDMSAYYLSNYPENFAFSEFGSIVNSYADAVFEPSPLNRILEQGAPGDTWKVNLAADNDHTVKNEWRVYEPGFFEAPIRRHVVNFVEAGNYHDTELIYKSNYQTGELFIEIVKNENWVPSDGNDNTIWQYTDIEGQLILKRNYESNRPHDTYYVYDDDNNLRYVLPPEGVNFASRTRTGAAVQESVLNNWCFQYQYDHWNRVVSKRVPGAEWMDMIYNIRDEVIMTQDGNQRERGVWLFTKYDVFGRAVYTGELTDASDRLQMQQQVDNENSVVFENRNATAEIFGGEELFYTHQAFPSEDTGITLLTINYYDNYAVGDANIFNPVDGEMKWNGMTTTQLVNGLATVSRVRVLETDQWITSASYYDNKGRPWMSYVNNEYLGTIEWQRNKLDFVGNVLLTNKTLEKDGKTTRLRNFYTYDHVNRLVKTSHRIGNKPEVVIAANKYDEIGQLIEKDLHSEDDGASFIQSIDYKYNVRGWLTHINNPELNNRGHNNDDNDFFGMQLGYDRSVSPVGLGIVEEFSGNITDVKWSHDVLGSGTDIYRYKYDDLSRITAAQYQGVGAETGAFDVKELAYDLNGNITALTRNGKTNEAIDELNYIYNNSNQLVSVNDNSGNAEGFSDVNALSDDYTYDANGNLSQDLNKDISDISYNYLNLPSIVTKNDGSTITYVYDATGTKHQQRVLEAGEGAVEKVTDYVNEFIYENDELALIKHPEGRLVPDEVNGGYDYQYHMKDHLGNTRLTFTSDPKTTDFLATMEGNKRAQEEALFNNLPETRRNFPAAAVSGTRVARTNKNKAVGPAISLPVNPGDVISLSAHAYFEGGTGYSNNASVTSLIAAVAGAFGGVDLGTETQQLTYDAFENALGVIGLESSADDNVPGAYLNYIFFNDKMEYKASGFRQITSAANFATELLTIDDIDITESGFIYCYLSYNSNSNQFVYWDDFNISLTEHPVIQKDDYYPFGLTHGNGYKSIANTENKFLYNGKEKQSDWDVFDFGSRMHDPAIGRFTTIDPLTEQYSFQSPYTYAANNPILFIDRNGEKPEVTNKPPKGLKIRVFSPQLFRHIKNNKDNEKEILRTSLFAVKNEFVDDKGNKSDFAERLFNRKFEDTEIEFPEGGKAGDFQGIDENKLVIEGLNFKTGKFEVLFEIENRFKTEEKEESSLPKKIRKKTLEHLFDFGVGEIFNKILNAPLMFPASLIDSIILPFVDEEPPLTQNDNVEEDNDA